MQKIPPEPSSTQISSIFSSTDGLGYTLQSNHRAAARLNLQHYLWRETLGYLIHPGVQIPEFNPVIADVATGTGLWPIHVARELPSAQLDGLDIDMTQAPQPAWLPGTIRLRSWDLFSPVPADLRGKFDLVHVRLLMLVLSGVDAAPAIENLMALLKPGGYIQWDDADTVHMKLKKVDESAAAPALEEIQTALYANGRHSWVVALPQILTGFGFENARVSYHDEPPELVRAFSDLHLMTMEEFAGRLVQMGQVESGRRFYELVQRGYVESVQGACLSLPRVVVFARKPLSSPNYDERPNRRPFESL